MAHTLTGRRYSGAATQWRPITEVYCIARGTRPGDTLMHDLSFVMQRIAAGDRVYFSYDYYGTGRGIRKTKSVPRFSSSPETDDCETIGALKLQVLLRHVVELV